ncbi:MAG: F0F1 ATP synthase subunit epsilon [Hyphomicrobiales bacterium]
MAGLHFELVSPARLLYSGTVASVTIPGTEGEMGIFPGHAPILSTLKPGVVTVYKDGGANERIFVRGGMVEVNPQGLTLLAEVAIPMAELSADQLNQQIRNAEEDLADAREGEAKRKAAETVEHLKAMRAAI